MFKAYIVQHCCVPDFHESVIVYHVTEEAAKELGRHSLSTANSWEETRVERAPQHDVRCVRMTEPDTEDDAEYLRLQGWGYEGEKSCDSCGLKAFGLKEYAVCATSQLCLSCGCNDNGDFDGEKPCEHPDGLSCESIR